jgi:hypothetical protein
MAVTTVYVVAPLNNPYQIGSTGALRWTAFNSELKAKDFLEGLENESEYAHDMKLYRMRVNVEAPEQGPGPRPRVAPAESTPPKRTGVAPGPPKKRT